MNLFDNIGAFFKAVASIFGWAQQRDAENNSPQIQANDAAKKAADAEDRITDEIAKQNIDSIRKDLAE